MDQVFCATVKKASLGSVNTRQRRTLKYTENTQRNKQRKVYSLGLPVFRDGELCTSKKSGFVTCFSFG